jgi:hypothetical protein
MVKYCLLVLAFAATHSAAASGTGMPASAAARPVSPAAADGNLVWRTAAAAALSTHGDAASLATAAALRYAGFGSGRAGLPKPVPSALELAARASELDPQNASISWLHLQLCSGTPACDIREVAIAMRWVDADNGAAWLQTLTAAQKDGDTVEVDRILADMAQGARFDLYWNRIVVMMVDALDAARDAVPAANVASDSARLNAVSGIASSEIIPPFSALMEACRQPGAAAERHDLCLKLSKTMQRGDTIVTQMIGFSIERRLFAPDSKEARVIAERKHLLEWRVAAAAKFDHPLLPWTKNARARARLVHMRYMRREEDVCIAILRQHRMALEPPEIYP